MKAGVAAALISLLEPIQTDFQASQEWQEIERQAYPPPETKKKEKKVKDKGSRHPGAARGVEAKPDGRVEGAHKDEVNLAAGAEQAMQNLEL